MGILTKAVKTLLTAHNYFNEDEYGSTWHNGKKPVVNQDGTVTAHSGTEALNATVKGQTAEGNATFAAVRVGYETFEVRRVEFDNSDLEETKPRKVIQR